jgi:hypothetical protein
MSEIEKYQTPQEKARHFNDEMNSGNFEVAAEQRLQNCFHEAQKALLALKKPAPHEVVFIFEKVYKEHGPANDTKSDLAQEFNQKLAIRVINWLDTYTGKSLNDILQERLEQGGAKTNLWREFSKIVAEVLSQLAGGEKVDTSGTNLAEELEIQQEDLIANQPAVPAGESMDASMVEISSSSSPEVENEKIFQIALEAYKNSALEDFIKRRLQAKPGQAKEILVKIFEQLWESGDKDEAEQLISESLSKES